MKRKSALVLVVSTVIVGTLACLLSWSGFIPVWAYETVLVLDFPLFVLGLGLWWMAGKGDEDIPFLGY